MDDLVRQLDALRIEREDAAKAYQRTVERTNRQERAIFERIQRQTRIDSQQTSDGQFRSNIKKNRRNPIKEGDTVRITNHYHTDEYGEIGVVTHVSTRMVEFKNYQKRKTYKRAWWNVEKVDPQSEQ